MSERLPFLGDTALQLIHSFLVLHGSGLISSSSKHMGRWMPSVSHAHCLVPSASRILLTDQTHSLAETHSCPDLVILFRVAAWIASLMPPALLVMTIYIDLSCLHDLICPPTHFNEDILSAFASMNRMIE